jgi:hypothetical protein
VEGGRNLDGEFHSTLFLGKIQGGWLRNEKALNHRHFLTSYILVMAGATVSNPTSVQSPYRNRFILESFEGCAVNIE